MTKIEQRQMQKLQNEVNELRAQSGKHFEVYRNHIYEISDLRIALKNAHDALIDAVMAINPVLRGAERGEYKINVEANV